MAETHEQQAVIAWASLVEAQVPELELLFSTLNGAVQQRIVGRKANGKPIWSANHQQLAKLKKEGLKKGVPDLLLLVPRGGYHGLAIEMKRPGGRVRPEQAKWLDKLHTQGYQALACFSAEEAIEAICDYLNVSNPVEFF